VLITERTLSRGAVGCHDQGLVAALLWLTVDVDAAASKARWIM